MLQLGPSFGQSDAYQVGREGRVMKERRIRRGRRKITGYVKYLKGLFYYSLGLDHYLGQVTLYSCLINNKEWSFWPLFPNS